MGAVIVRGVLAVAALLMLVPLFVPHARMANVIRGKRYGMLGLFLYFLVAAVSTLWSASPYNTAGKVLEIGVAFGLVWVLVMRDDAVDALAKMRGPSEDRAKLVSALFFKPNQSIARVITIGTPHLGSSLAEHWGDYFGTRTTSVQPSATLIVE